MSVNLWEARGRVRDTKPSATPSQVDGWLNRRIKNVLDVRTWSDTMKFGMIVIPNAYNTGTVTMTQNSPIVAGVGTAWPVNDAISTVSVNPVMDSPGFMEIQPGAGFIGLIQPGMILLFDQENASVTEIITVQSVGPVNFTAYCQYAHDTNASLQQSSLAGLQFSTNTYTYTVQAVLSSTSLQLNVAFGGQPIAGSPYQIRKEYCIISPTARFLKAAWDAIAGQTIGTERDEDWLNLVDPQDQSTGNPLELARMRPAPGGVMQWRMWPFQTTNYAVGVLYQDGWPTLKYDTDLLPPFINSEVFISGATADALRTKCIKKAGDRDDWYDPQGAMVWEKDYEDRLEVAIQSDQGRRLSYLSNYLEDLQSACYNWQRAHAVTAYGAGWGTGL